MKIIIGFKYHSGNDKFNLNVDGIDDEFLRPPNKRLPIV
jgi:hypothetical protein